MSVGESIGCISPSCGSYSPLSCGWSDFSNILTKSAIERLAQVDEYEVVREVQVRKCWQAYSESCLTGFYPIKEYFADYAPVSSCLFSLNHVPSASRPLFGATVNAWDPRALELAMQGITAVLLSLRKKPIIRYERMSTMAKKLGVEVQVGTSGY